MPNPTPLLALLFVLTTSAHASMPPFHAPPVDQPIGACFASAAAQHDVPQQILVAIASVESSFDPSATGTNKNGSRDIGLMQINSLWLKRLQEEGIREADLYQPCTSIYVGAWILRHYMNIHGKNWKAVGRYNATDKRPERQAIYAAKVKSTLASL